MKTNIRLKQLKSFSLFIKELFENRKKLFIFWTILVLINLMDLYLKYLSDFEKNYHVIHKPFFVLFLSFILVLILLNKKEKILLITLIISAFSNIFDIIFNNLTIINYINFYFFYNNLSDILVSVVLLLEIVYYFSDKNEKE